MLKKLDLLRPGETCWRIADAARVGVLVDSAAYFAAAYEALQAARHSVLLIGWSFDPRVALDPRNGEPRDATAIGAVLDTLARERPELDVRVLIWNMAVPMAMKSGFVPQRAALRFRNSPVDYRLDRVAPIGACQHQKILVVDDAIGFCGGGDFGAERWDTRRHLDHHHARRLPSGKPYPPRHEVMMMVEGEAAAALGDLARERWRRATGEVLTPPPKRPGAAAGPEHVTFELPPAPIGIARTEPERGDAPAVRENEALFGDMIAAAEKTIYLENQYFASVRIAELLGARLQERDGPEVFVVCTAHSPGVSDRLCMDSVRKFVIGRLRAADRYGRFHIMAPYTEGGRPVIVHSKVTIVDDRVLRVGSTNLNNRSMALDSECDLVVDALSVPGEDMRRAVARFRAVLIGHYLGRSADDVEAAIATEGGLARAVARLNDPHAPRLRPVPSGRLGPLARLIAKYHLGDPQSVHDVWRPWRRTQGTGPYLRGLTRKSTTSGR